MKLTVGAIDANFFSTQAKLKTLLAEAMFGTPTDYTEFLAGELPKWTAMAKLSGAGAE
jgi:hypothetical protein